MTKIQKLKDKFSENPSSVKYKDIENILLSYGFEKIRAKGSHIKFKHPKLKNDIVLPIHNGECEGIL